MDRSGRTYEEYRQLYWDEKARRKELEAQLSDGYVCDVCAGDPKSVENCACNGTGQMHETVVTLRKTIFELEAQLEAEIGFNNRSTARELESGDRIKELEAQLSNVVLLCSTTIKTWEIDNVGYTDGRVRQSRLILKLLNRHTTGG